MFRKFACLFAALFLATYLPARTHNDWQNVKKLKSGTPVSILLWSGDAIHGRVNAVDDTGLRIVAFDRTNSGIDSPLDVNRATVSRIVRIRQPHLPDPGRWMIMGALVGGVIGVTSGAIYDGTHHANGRWLTGGMAGAGLGFFASCASLAAVGAVDVGTLVFHHDKVVYEDQRATPILRD